MPDPAYFDTSTFLELLNTSTQAPDIRLLIAELQASKTRIYTSILTVQEASVLSFMRGNTQWDMYALIAQFARIYSMDKPIAVAAARMEANIRDMFKQRDEGQQEAKHRRRWDCIHLATAQVLGCRDFYAFDKHFFTREKQLDLGSLRVRPPTSSKPQLPLKAAQSNLALVKSKAEDGSK